MSSFGTSMFRNLPLGLEVRVWGARFRVRVLLTIKNRPFWTVDLSTCLTCRTSTAVFDLPNVDSRCSGFDLTAVRHLFG